jgi:hypothetical protein
MFDAQATKIWEQALSTRDASVLTSFMLISFADLKKYKYYYWFAFPAFVAKPAWEIPNGLSPASDHFSSESASILPLTQPLSLTIYPSSPLSTPHSALAQRLLHSSSSTTTLKSPQ